MIERPPWPVIGPKHADSVSHESILEDQGRDPVAWLAERGVPRHQVLEDATDIAANYSRTPRDFDKDGPHVVTGPIRVEGAEPGDVLKIETLDLRARVPYGVVSSRHGKGALAMTADGAPAGITLDEVMPPRETDGRGSGEPTDRVRHRFGVHAGFVLERSPRPCLQPAGIGAGVDDQRHQGAGRSGTSSAAVLPTRSAVARLGLRLA